MFRTLRHRMVPETNWTVCLNTYISYNGAARGSDSAGCSLNIDMTKTDAVVFCFQVLCRNFSRRAAKLQYPSPEGHLGRDSTQYSFNTREKPYGLN
jgi:hypothetical protein